MTLAIPWIVPARPSLSMGFSREEYWSGLSFPSPGGLPDPGIKPGSPALQADDLPIKLWGKPLIGDWNAKAGSQEIPGITGKFGLRVQNEAGEKLTEFCQENMLVIANILFYNLRDNSTHGHHQMVNTEIRLLIFFAAKDGEALYRQQKQDWELTVAQIMNSLLPNSDLNWRE